MTVKSLSLSIVLLLLSVVLTALFWRHQFANTPPSLRNQVSGESSGDTHVYGESPRQDAIAQRALLADAQRGNPSAQFMQAMMLEPVDMKEALRWYEAAAAQGYEGAIERLQQLREQAAQRPATP
ncbi:sel1 repeat family protein [Achromobacter pestifer]